MSPWSNLKGIWGFLNADIDEVVYSIVYSNAFRGMEGKSQMKSEISFLEFESPVHWKPSCGDGFGVSLKCVLHEFVYVFCMYEHASCWPKWN